MHLSSRCRNPDALNVKSSLCVVDGEDPGIRQNQLLPQHAVDGDLRVVTGLGVCSIVENPQQEACSEVHRREH